MADWQRLGLDVPLEVVHSPYRELVGPLEAWLAEQRLARPQRLRTVVIAEIELRRWQEAILHSQSALNLREHLLAHADVAVASVPYRRGGPPSPPSSPST